jgi:hypothetical protein
MLCHLHSRSVEIRITTAKRSHEIVALLYTRQAKDLGGDMQHMRTLSFLLIVAITLSACEQRYDMRDKAQIDIQPQCTECTHIQAIVSFGCWSSSNTRAISRDAQVVVDHQQRVLSFTTHAVAVDLGHESMTGDCGGVGFVTVPIGVLPPGTYLVKLGGETLGAYQVPNDSGLRLTYCRIEHCQPSRVWP